jgi:hypothetical protein
MKKAPTRSVILAIVIALVCSSTAFAKVSAKEAERLKSDLTPMGAERAGNADGTIPAWEGGLSSVPAGIGYQGKGTLRPNPFPNDKVILTINAQNVDKYTDKLSAGVIALIKRYPDTFRLDVYQTRRTQAAPQWVYDNTYANATLCEITPDGLGIVPNGGSKGVPFPIPQKAEEVIWNNTLTFGGGSYVGRVRFAVVQRNGSMAISALDWFWKSPWYDRNPEKDSSFKNMAAISIAWYAEPAKEKGNVTLVWDPLNQSTDPREAWSYLPGQRRVRRAPTVAYDTPNAVCSALINYDDIGVFNGALDRYDWKLVGKKELYIPYNNYAVDLASMEELLPPNHFNPALMRWELHRVWVVEATLKQGARHAVARRTIYIDEDSWGAQLGDSYDGHGKLWRIYLVTKQQAYEVPSTPGGAQFGFDLQRNDYAALYMINGLGKQLLYDEFMPDSHFTPDYVRTLGTR